MVPHVVVEEIWSISSFDDEQRLLRSTARPLFYGGRRAAFDCAKQCASEFDTRGFQENAQHPYWWGRDDGDRANHRFVMKPARTH
jgi:hypothetical protein